MNIDHIMRIAEQVPRADKSAVGAINRPLQVAGGVCYKPLSTQRLAEVFC